MKVKSESELAQSCLTLSDPMDCSLPASSIHGIFQARVLEWGAIAFSDLCHGNWKMLQTIFYSENQLLNINQHTTNYTESSVHLFFFFFATLSVLVFFFFFLPAIFTE